MALSPGALASREAADTFTVDLKESVMSGSLDLRQINFWSDADGDHTSGPAGAVRTWEWKKAAEVVRGLTNADGQSPTPGDVCTWGGLNVHYAGSDTLLITGDINHFTLRAKSHVRPTLLDDVYHVHTVTSWQ